MALPLIGASLAGGVVAGLIQFFINRGGMILAGLGLTLAGVKGFQSVIGFIISDMQSLVASGSGGSSGLGAKMLQFAAFAGLFDGVNILISGYMVAASYAGVRFILAKL